MKTKILKKLFYYTIVLLFVIYGVVQAISIIKTMTLLSIIGGIMLFLSACLIFGVFITRETLYYSSISKEKKDMTAK